jgi:hypothetical protein
LIALATLPEALRPIATAKVFSMFTTTTRLNPDQGGLRLSKNATPRSTAKTSLILAIGVEDWAVQQNNFSRVYETATPGLMEQLEPGAETCLNGRQACSAHRWCGAFV